MSTRDSVPFNPRTGDDRIVLGVIASSEGPSAHDDDEVIRGLRAGGETLEAQEPIRHDCLRENGDPCWIEKH